MDKSICYVGVHYIPSLDYDWFENSVRQKKIEGFGLNAVKIVGETKLPNGYTAIVTFHAPTKSCKRHFFGLTLYDKGMQYVAGRGNIRSLKELENYKFPLGDNANCCLHFYRKDEGMEEN